MLDIEVLGAAAIKVERAHELCEAALAAVGIRDGHVAVEFVDAERIAELNAEFRGKSVPTDVLSFPVDGPEYLAGRGFGGTEVELGDISEPGVGDPSQMELGDISEPDVGDASQLELGDIVICPQYTEDLEEAVVHGALHLAGMDHERDDGEMLELQAKILLSKRR